MVLVRNRCAWYCRAALAFLLTFSAAHTVSARTWYVKVDGSGDAPTIKAAVDSTSPGDTILVAPGTYTWSNQGTGSPFGLIEIPGTKSNFVLISEGGPLVTILDAERQGRVMFVAGLNYITIDGFTITGGEAPDFGNYAGGGIAMHLTHDIYRNLIIVDNHAETGGGIWCGGVSDPYFENVVIKRNVADYGGGIYFINSSLLPTMYNCWVHDNTAQHDGGGIFAYNNGIYLENTVLAKNRCFGEGGGIFSWVSEQSYVVGCTIVGNQAPLGGFLYVLSGVGYFLGRSIIANTIDAAPFALSGGAVLQASCNDTFGNAFTNSFPAGTVNLGGNFIADPLFCSTVGVAYQLADISPCAPGNHPQGNSCELVGAAGVDCEYVPVEQLSWGRIKKLYE